MMNQQNGMDPQDQRNFIVAMVLMIAFVFLYQQFVLGPDAKRANEARERALASQQATAPDAVPGSVETITAPPVAATVEEALVQSERLDFNGDRVDGSIRLTGAVIDDLNLKDHTKRLGSPEELRLLRPASAEYGFYGSWFWLDTQNRAVAGNQDAWSVATDAAMTTVQPVKLMLEKDGLRFERTISIDDNYMFTFADTITNTTGDARTLVPYGSIRRHGNWKGFLEATDPGSSKKTGLVHQGLVGVVDGRLKLRNYKNLAKGKGIKGGGETTPGSFPSEKGGWLGFTDMYWMAALVPEQDRAFEARFDLRGASKDVFEATAKAAPVTIAAGETVTVSNRLFAGAKEYKVVKAYKAAGIPRFDDAIDWGSFEYYISRPFFALLNWLKSQLGSFGLAILALVVIIKIPLVPLYNTSYKSMAKMKKLTEPMKEIQERFKADPQRKQQEIMKLYQREKANPLAGCIPILFTIPVFFALYKILYVTLEMRHTPFMFLNDLSAPDPTAFGNLFGLLPWAAADVKAIPLIGFIIGIGILPILYGVTMAAIQSLSPPPPDPTQRTIMMALPVVFMFVFGSFASGLVLYWVWNNILSLIQQYVIMRRNGVDTQLDKLIAFLRNRRIPDQE